jgi:hypothetical protein
MHYSYEKVPTNLTYLGKNSLKHKNRFERRTNEKRHKAAQKVIKKAIYTICPPELADAIINGFRRSDGSDEAAEADFLKTDQPKVELDRDYHYRRALRVTEQLFRPSKRLLPISFPDLRYYPWTLNVSAEAPFTVQPYWTNVVREKQRDGDIDNGAHSFHNLYNEVFHLNRQHIHSIKRRNFPFFETINFRRMPRPYYWASLHTRAHLVKEGKPDKNRAVFGVPKLLLMAENMFIWPLQKEYLNGNVKSPMLWGFETLRGGWKKLIERLTRSINPNGFISADWSGFDHKALHSIIDDVHSMWRSWFDFDAGYEPTNVYPRTTTDPEEIESLWEWMTWNIKHQPIRAESGNMYQWKFNGIASGYQQTQLLDSFVNCIMLLTCLSSLSINIEGKDFTIHVQGDDSIVSFAEMILLHQKKEFLSALATEAKRRFNADLSADKTFAGTSLDDLEVLSYRNRSGLAERDPDELLARLLYPERNRDYEATAAAAVGIATAAMGCSRIVYDVCKDVYTFITVELGLEPSLLPHDWIYRSGLPIDVTKFPSYEETFLANFNTTSRTKAEKQRLWPTLLTGVTDLNPQGFYFLRT